MNSIEQESSFDKDSSGTTTTTSIDTDKNTTVNCRQEVIELPIQEVTQQDEQEQQDDEDNDEEEVETVNKQKATKNCAWSIKKKISIFLLSVLSIIIVYFVCTMEKYPIVYEKNFSLDTKKNPIIPESFLNAIRKDLGLPAYTNILKYFTDFGFDEPSMEEDAVIQFDDSQLFKKNLCYKNAFEIIRTKYDNHIADDDVDNIVSLNDDFNDLDDILGNAHDDKNEYIVWKSIIRNNFVTLASIFIKLGYNVNKEFIVKDSLYSKSFPLSLLQMCVDYGNIDIAYEFLKHNANPSKIDAAFPDKTGRLVYDPVRYLIYSYRFESSKCFDFL